MRFALLKRLPERVLAQQEKLAANDPENLGQRRPRATT